MFFKIVLNFNYTADRRSKLVKDRANFHSAQPSGPKPLMLNRSTLEVFSGIWWFVGHSTEPEGQGLCSDCEMPLCMCTCTFVQRLMQDLHIHTCSCTHPFKGRGGTRRARSCFFHQQRSLLSCLIAFLSLTNSRTQREPRSMIQIHVTHPEGDSKSFLGGDWVL